MSYFADQFMAKVVDRITVTESRFEENMHAYNTALRELVDTDAPMKRKTIKIVPSAPGLMESIVHSESKEEKQRKEQKELGRWLTERTTSL